MIVSFRLPLNVATIILGRTFTIQFKAFIVWGLSIPTPLIVEFFHDEAEIMIHSFPHSWCWRSRFSWYIQCTSIQISSISWEAASDASSDRWCKLLRVWTLKVEILTVRLRLILLKNIMKIVKTSYYNVKTKKIFFGLINW